MLILLFFILLNLFCFDELHNVCGSATSFSIYLLLRGHAAEGHSLLPDSAHFLHRRVLGTRRDTQGHVDVR